MAAGFTGLPERRVDPSREIDNVARLSYGGLNNRKLVAAQPGDSVGVSETGAQASGHDLQQFITDRVPERVVDGLELIEVEVEQRQTIAAADALERLLEL